MATRLPRAALASSSPCLCRPSQPIVLLSRAARNFTSMRPSTSRPAVRPPRPPFGISEWTSGSRTRAHERSFHSSRSVAAKDPYQVLGVGKDATSPDVKKAYYALAKKYHPDSNKDKAAQAKFVEIQEAYDVLSDDKKRADWDRFGPTSQQQGFDSEAYTRASSSFGGAGFGDFFNQGGGGQNSDLFESLFGAFGRGGQARPGQGVRIGDDIDAAITLTFTEAALGTKKSVNITPIVDCNVCAGSGMKEGMKKSACATCGGTGTRTFTIQSGFQMASTCNSCGGSGTTTPPGSGCGNCNALGKVRDRKTVEVAVPAGVDDGMKIRIDGQGDAPTQGKGRSGDLFVRLSVLPSKTFTRQGANLYENVSVPFYTAILGGRARVATLDKEVDVRVATGTQPGEEFVLKGRGIKRLYKDGHGDLTVRFNIAIPRNLTAAQRRIIQQYVSETEYPGSSAYAPMPPRNPAPPSPPPSEPTPPPQFTSPGFTSQASPPPSEPTTEPKQWWKSLDTSEDIEAPVKRQASKTPPTSPPSSPSREPTPTPPTPSPTPTPESTPKATPTPPTPTPDELPKEETPSWFKRWMPKK